MSTLIGFAPDAAPGARAPAFARSRRLRLVAVASSLLLLLPIGGASAGKAAPPSAPAGATLGRLAQIHPGELSGPEIESRVRPALWRLTTNPEAESAFAFAHVGRFTYLATTYQNVLRSATPNIPHRLNKALHTFVGGVHVDPSFPVHQVVLVRKGSLTLRAQVIAAELERDVAVLRVAGDRAIMTPECSGSPQSPRLGDRTFVFSAGPQAGATDPTRTFGRISGFQPPEQIQTSQSIPRFGEGGPLVNVRGNVIGIAARGADASDVRGFREAYSLSVDINVAFSLAGALNTCPETDEEPAEPEGADVEELPSEDPLRRWRVAELALPAVVTLESVEDNGLVWGSGFGVYSDGASTWIATNHHVLGDGRFLTDPALTVRRSQQDVTNDGDQARPADLLAEIVASRKDMDVALVRVDAALPTLPVECDRLRVGTPVVAIGSPGDFLGPAKQREVVTQFVDDFFEIELPFFFARELLGLPVDFQPWVNQGLSPSFGNAIVDPHPYGLPHWSRHPVLEDTVTFGAVKSSKFKDVRHNAKVFRGNSGGPLLNLNGEVVGVNYKVNRRGQPFAVNIRRLFGSLSAKAGIPNPCGPVTEEGGEGDGSGDPPVGEPTPTPVDSPTLPTVAPTQTGG